MAHEHDVDHGRDRAAAPPATGPETAADANVAIPSRSRTPASISWMASAAPGTLPEPELEVEQGPQAELLEHDGVTGLGAEMSRDDAFNDGRRQPRGDEGRCATNEPVEHHGHTTGDRPDAGFDEGARRLGDVAGDGALGHDRLLFCS